MFTFLTSPNTHLHPTNGDDVAATRSSRMARILVAVAALMALAVTACTGAGATADGAAVGSVTDSSVANPTGPTPVDPDDLAGLSTSIPDGAEDGQSGAAGAGSDNNASGASDGADTGDSPDPGGTSGSGEVPAEPTEPEPAQPGEPGDPEPGGEAPTPAEPEPTDPEGPAEPADPTPGPCDAATPLPEGIAHTSLAGADLDGDGVVDTLHVYAVGDPAADDAWRLRVYLDGGRMTERILHGVSSVSGARVFDGVDFNADGSDEIVVRMGSGASARTVGIFGLDEGDCTLPSMNLDDAPAALTVGASIGQFSGFACVDQLGGDGVVDTLVTHIGQQVGDSTTYEVTARFFRLTGNDFVPVFADGAVVEAGDPGFDALATADCAGLGSL
ncbi:MAG: hypothetical protein AAF467_10420 [Actinomycetota bacterium]